ncbi:leucyl aminopeptidase [Candidatus Woesearchaeota archaeon]|nr:leucyl aminopeptidase [Candidatus Woesearchaeota archaeon]
MERQTTSVKVIKLEKEAKDNTLVFCFFKDKLVFSKSLEELDRNLDNAISNPIKNKHFKGEKSEIREVYAHKHMKNILLVGLGEEQKLTFDVLKNIIADASKKIRNNGAENFSIFLDSFTSNRLNEADVIENLVLSSLMGMYQFTEFKTKDRDKIKNVRQITLITNSNKNFDSQIRYASVVADAVNKTRDLVNTPPNIATPEFVANYAKELARKSGLKCAVFDEKQVEKMKMGCFIGVAQGSANKPRLVVLEYNGSSKKPIAIVGKGVTFDSGGLNVKPYPYILNMKDDKGGAVAAMHIIEACSKLKLPLSLVVITPLCENMIDAASYRPDDVLKAYNGTTVEVKNTDAEGRLILADALSYTLSFKPQAIIDIATLTGASFVALGYIGTPFLTTDEKLRDRIKSASEKSLERMWELPLWPEYEENIKSDVADIKHLSEEGDAGVIIGATFLKNFVGDVPWAHIDIGTTVWSKVEKGILTKGATGASVRLVLEMLRNWK